MNLFGYGLDFDSASVTAGGVHPQVARLPVQLLRVGRGPLRQRAPHRRHHLLQGSGKAPSIHRRVVGRYDMAFFLARNSKF